MKSDETIIRGASEGESMPTGGLQIMCRQVSFISGKIRF